MLESGLGSYYPEPVGWVYTQQFDMHGQSSLCGVPPYFLDRGCGVAGSDYDVQYNSFLYTAGPAVKVRGLPHIGAVVNFNTFAHDSLSDAVQETEVMAYVLGLLREEGNQVSVTPYAFDCCDFDGDGIPDRFLTTGQTWWFSSNHGQGPWIYLNTSTYSLQHSDISLGYFDGDNLCDVVTGGVTYSNGMPQPPQRLGPRPIPAKARLLQ